MDINDLRSIVTLVTFVMFAGIVAWAYSGHRRQAFEEAANVPFDEEPTGTSVNALRIEERKS